MTTEDLDDLVGRRWLGGVERAWFYSRDVRLDRGGEMSSPRRSLQVDDAKIQAIVVRLDGAVYVMWPVGRIATRPAARLSALAVARLGSESCPFLPGRCAEALIRGPSILPPIECDVARGERGGVQMTRTEDGSRVLDVDVDDLGRLVVARTAEAQHVRSS